MTVSSPAFEMNDMIPEEYTCKGKDVNPPLDIELIPENTKSLAIVMDEPDAPYGCFCHWVMWNLPVLHHIREDESRGMFGMNDFGNHRYNGPCSAEGIHRYFFRVYALNAKLDIPASCDRMQFDKAMRKHIVGYTILVAKSKA